MPTYNKIKALQVFGDQQCGASRGVDNAVKLLLSLNNKTSTAASKQMYVSSSGCVPCSNNSSKQWMAMLPSPCSAYHTYCLKPKSQVTSLAAQPQGNAPVVPHVPTMLQAYKLDFTEAKQMNRIRVWNAQASQDAQLTWPDVPGTGAPPGNAQFNITALNQAPGALALAVIPAPTLRNVV